MKALTLLRFIISFISSPSMRAALVADVEAGAYAKLAYNLGRAGSRRLVNQFLRYCPRCALEQKEKYGEAYWTRLPQIRGIDYCPIHRTRIVDSRISRRHPTDLHRLNPVLIAEAGIREPGDEKKESLLALSKAASRLLDLEPTWDTDQMNRGWHSIFLDQGIRAHSRGATKYIAEGLRKKFGDSYLTSSGCGLGSSINYSWIARFIRHPTEEPDPLRHLLVLELSGRSTDDLAQITEPLFITPRIDENKLICTNPICPNRGAYWNGHIHIFRGPHTRKQTAYFTCRACDRTYGRILEGKIDESKDWIVRRGVLWISHLREMWSANVLSLREIGRRLCADPLTIKRHSAKMGLHFPRRTVRPTFIVPTKITPKTLSTDEHDIRRGRWLMALKQTKYMARARRLEPATYAWLRRNDRLWLEENRPARAPLSRASSLRVDWSAHERLYLGTLPEAHFRIVSRTPFQQCTLWSLANEIGAEQKFRYLDRMPTLKRQMIKLVEDDITYAQRRITSVLQDHPNPSSFSEIRKLAGVRSTTATIPAVRKYLLKRFVPKINNLISFRRFWVEN